MDRAERGEITLQKEECAAEIMALTKRLKAIGTLYRKMSVLLLEEPRYLTLLHPPAELTEETGFSTSDPIEWKEVPEKVELAQMLMQLRQLHQKQAQIQAKLSEANNS